jgi:hypothetical protein
LPLDPNWFYSTLAQSAAALVGLLGAITAGRIQEQYQTSRASLARMIEVLRGYRGFIQSLRQGVERFRAFNRKHIADARSYLDDGLKGLPVDSIVDFWGGGWSGARREIEISEGYIERQKTFLAHADQLIAAVDPHLSAATPEEILAAFRVIAALKKTLPEELHEEIDKSLPAAQIGIERALGEHAATTSIRTPGMIVGTMAWLCLFCLIVPLGYLSAQGSCSKLLLLGAFAVGVAAIPVYIGATLVEIHRMKRVRIPEP